MAKRLIDLIDLTDTKNIFNDMESGLLKYTGIWSLATNDQAKYKLWNDQSLFGYLELFGDAPKNDATAKFISMAPEMLKQLVCAESTFQIIRDWFEMHGTRKQLDSLAYTDCCKMIASINNELNKLKK